MFFHNSFGAAVLGYLGDYCSSNLSSQVKHGWLSAIFPWIPYECGGAQEACELWLVLVAAPTPILCMDTVGCIATLSSSSVNSTPLCAELRIETPQSANPAQELCTYYIILNMSCAHLPYIFKEDVHTALINFFVASGHCLFKMSASPAALKKLATNRLYLGDIYNLVKSQKSKLQVWRPPRLFSRLIQGIWWKN